jgi:ATP-dependent RNA helicase DeaD
MTNFASLGLDPDILKAITDLGFENPTPVQAKIIPQLISSRDDLVALAQTGTGKTAAFGLPLLQQLDTSSGKPQAIILSPTRELCLQICRDIKQFSKYMKAVKTVAIYGGAPIVNQLRALERGVHIIVATPGRMHDILRRNKADLTNIRWTVLDEADEMLNMGFEEDLKAILAHVADDAQKLLFSATMPKQIASITGKYMQKPVEITIGTRNTGAENVHHECYMVHARDRYPALKRLVDFYPHIYGLVFCRTRAETQDVASRLMKDGYSADALHGDLSQLQRDRVMDKFRERSIQILVATDVAARGLDINNLTHVINYQLPDELESYTHRSGRTGRAGKEGTSIVLINMREKFKIKFIEKKLGKKFEYRQVPLGQQVCEAQLMHLISRVKNVEVDDKQIDPYLPEVMKMLEGMPSDELVKRFVSLEFNRFLEYYRNAPDLNVQDKSKREIIKGKLTPLFINVGKLDRFSPKDLMGMINRGTRSGETIQVGRINITQNCSFFDVAEGDGDAVMQILNGAEFGNRQIRIEIADGNKTRRVPKRDRGGDAPRRGSRGGRDNGGRGGRDGGNRGGRDSRSSSGGYASNSNRGGSGSGPKRKPRSSAPTGRKGAPAQRGDRRTAPKNEVPTQGKPDRRKKGSTAVSHASSKIKQAQRKAKRSSKPVDERIPPWARNIPKHKKKK